MEVCVSECVVGPDQVQPKRWRSVVRRVACALTRGGREIEEERRDERERGGNRERWRWRWRCTSRRLSEENRMMTAVTERFKATIRYEAGERVEGHRAPRYQWG